MADGLKETAQIMVRRHREQDPNLLRAFIYYDPAGREIRLVEVVKDSPEADQVLPFRFAAAKERGIDFPVVIVELSPDEFARVEAGHWRLPQGWTEREELLPVSA